MILELRRHFHLLLHSRRSRRVVTMALPIMLSNVSVPLVGIVDTAVMGRMSEPSYLGAVAIGAIIFSSVFWLFGFLRMGTGGLVAQALGTASIDSTQTTTTVSTGSSGASGTNGIDAVISRALVTGGAIGLLIVLAQVPIGVLALKAFEVTSDVKTLAADYFTIRVFAAPATLMTYSILGALIGLQQMRSVLVLQLVLNIGNVLLTLLFFSVFDAGIKGVAMATVIAEYLALAYGLHRLQTIRRFWPLQVSLHEILDGNALARLFRVNRDLFIRTLCLTFSFYWLTRSGAKINELTLAANSILIHMVHFSAHALDGFAHAAETLCGNAYGRAQAMLKTTTQKPRKAELSSDEAGNIPASHLSPSDDFRQTVMLTHIWGYLFALGFVLVFLLFGEAIIAMMTTQEAVREHANRWLPWIIISPLIGVSSFLLDGIYIGVTHTRDMRNAMVVSALVFLVANLLLVQLLGNTGLWMSYFVLMLARTLTLYRTYPRIMKRVK